MDLNNYEDALTSYIQDDDRLVTYKWLSKEFEIHVNVAKLILKQYWEKHRNNKKITATFLIVGQLKDKSICVKIVKESNLNTVKDKFINIDCEHIYSLQNSLQDLELLTFRDEGDFRYSAIKFNTTYLSVDEKIQTLSYIRDSAKEESKFIESNKIVNKFLENQMPNQIDSFTNIMVKNVLKNKNTKEEKFVESKSREKKIVSENIVFPIIKSINNTKLLKNNKKVEEIPIQSKNSSFNNLFTKGSTNLKIPNKIINCDSDKQKNSLCIFDSEMKTYKEKDIQLFTDKEKNANDNITNKSNEKIENRKLQSTIKNKNNSKNNNKINDNLRSKNSTDAQGKKGNHNQENISLKRKRIIVMDSSEDEFDNVDFKEKDRLETKEEISTGVKKSSVSTGKHENIKQMVKKTVDKTFKDNDGYLVTKRVHVYEVSSDIDEQSVQTKKEEPFKIKSMEVKAKKQTTLMNFFKKS